MSRPGSPAGRAIRARPASVPRSPLDDWPDRIARWRRRCGAEVEAALAVRAEVAVEAGRRRNALAVDRVVEPAVQPVEDPVLLILRELLVGDGLVELLLHGVLDRALQAVDRLLLVARDV